MLPCTQKELNPYYLEYLQDRKRVWVAFMVTVYGDESYDAERQRVLALTGIGGTQQEWKDIETKWIERNSGIPFHASECEADRGPYKGNTHAENLKLYKDNVQIIANSRLIGFSVVLDLAVLKQFFPNVMDGFPYLFCFSGVIRFFSDKARQYIPQEDSVKFTFHRNQMVIPPAQTLYEYISKSPAVKDIFDNIDEVAFASMEKKVGIQIADTVAREAMKHYDNIVIGTQKIPRQSLRALLKTKRFDFVIHAQEYFEDFSEKLEELESQSGINSGSLSEWLDDKRLNDNLVNRIHYLSHMSNIKTSRIN